MSKPFISKFTPSLMSDLDLRGMFVQRGALLSSIDAGLRESITTENKHHYLLIGPRGIGKTHLISLVFHNLNNWAEERDNFLIAWLREEEYVSSFLDLSMRIAKSVQAFQPGVLSNEELEFAWTLPLDEAQAYLLDLLERVLEHKTLVLLVENLNDIFDAIGEEGQRRLRSFIQQTSKISMVASTPSIFASVSLQTSPFYGFFQIERLSELSISEAKELLSRIADREDNHALAAFIQSPEGDAKVEAIYHLAGGNHRVYIILSQFIAGESISDIVGPFIDMLDDLTPYYQSQLAQLSPQQRKIIQFLCDSRYAVAVKDIASKCFMTQQTTSSQLKDLKDQEFVSVIPVGRESRYEIREPLLRFCMELKQTRGEPIKVLVEFLQTWYSSREINQLLELSSPTAGLNKQYLAKALEVSQPKKVVESRQAAHLRSLEQQQMQLVEARKLTEVLVIEKEIVSERGSAEDYDKLGFCYAALNQTSLALRNFEEALKIDPSYTLAFKHKQMALLKLGRFNDCIEMAEQRMGNGKADSKDWDFMGVALMGVGRTAEAYKAFERSLQLEPRNADVLCRAGSCLIKEKKYEGALEWLDRALLIDPKHVYALTLKGFLLASLDSAPQAIRYFDKAVKLDNSMDQAWLGKGMTHIDLGQYDEAIAACDKALKLDNQLTIAEFFRTAALFALGQATEYRKELEALLRQLKKSKKDSSCDFGVLLRYLLDKSSDRVFWEASMLELLEEFQKFDLLPTLATAVANTIPILISQSMTQKKAETWIRLCETLFANRIEFATSLRLLDTCRKYLLVHKAELVDADLSAEERKIFGIF